jgi:hypothetical protein
MPRKSASVPVVHAVVENNVAVAELVPVRVNDGPDVTLSGARMSSRRLPEVGPGEVVKPKFVGGLCDVGELVPLSTHCPAPAQNPCRVACAVPGMVKTPANASTPANAEFAATIFITVSRYYNGR